MCIKTKACGEKEYHLFNNGLMVKDLAFKHGGERMWGVQINVGLLYRVGYKPIYVSWGLCQGPLKIGF